MDWLVWLIAIPIALVAAWAYTKFMWTSTENDARKFSRWWYSRRKRK